MKYIIVGGGNSVYYLSRSLTSKGHHVTIINRNYDECTHLARKLKAVIINGDASNKKILEQAGASSADAIFVITLNDHDNLVICQLAQTTFNIPKIFTLVDDPDNEFIFNQLGVQNVLSINRILTSLIEEKTGYDDVTNLLSLAEGKVNFTKVKLTPASPILNKNLSDISMPENTLIAVILRNGNPIIPRGSTTLQADDQLIVLNSPADHSKVIRLLTGEK